MEGYLSSREVSDLKDKVFFNSKSFLRIREEWSDEVEIVDDFIELR